MKKKKLYLACICIGLMLLTACAADSRIPAETPTALPTEENKVETSPAVETDESNSDIVPEESPSEPEETASEPEYVYPSEDMDPVQEESRLGYAMTFDPTVFTLDDTGESQDIYTYHTAETLDGPVYVAIQLYPDMDAQTLADGIVLQSGQDGVAVQDTYFGADNLEAKSVSYEEVVNGVTQVHTFYALPKGEGALLVEITGYADLPLQIQAKLEEMAGTFKLV